MADTQNLQQDLEKILNNYSSTLQECVKRVSDNNKLNKLNEKVVNEIQNKIVEIKKKVIKARNDVDEIGKRQTNFDKAMNKEKEQIKLAREAREKESNEKKKMLEKQLEDSKNDSDAQIQKLKAQQEEEIKKIQERMQGEANTALAEQHEQDEEKMKLKLLEVKEEANRKESEAKALAEITQKDADEAKRQADNEAAEQVKKFEELEKQTQAILEKDQDSEKKLKELEEHIKKMNDQIEELNGSLKEQIKTNEEDKKKAAAEKLAEIEKLNKDHETAMKTQIEKAVEDKRIYMEGAAETQKTAIEKAVKDAQDAYERMEAEKSRATQDTTDALNAKLEECDKSKVEYMTQVEAHLAKYNELEKQFESSSKLVLDDLQELVRKLGDEDIKDLQTTIAGILSKKGPGGTGTGGTGIYEPKESNIRKPKPSGSFNFGRSLSSDMSEEGQAMNLKMRGQQTQQDHKKPSGNPKEAWREEESHALAIDQDWANQNKKNLATNMKDAKMVKKILLEGIEMYINNIGSYNQFEDLEKRIVNPRLHGMEKVIGNEYEQSMEKAKTGKYDYQRQRGLYHKILNSMVSYDSNAYEYIIKEINRVGFEKVFEQLITAFHLLYSPESIPQLYNEGVDKAESYFKRNGKLAIKLWYGEYKGVRFDVIPVTADELKKNAETNKDRLSGNSKRIAMRHRYYHKHDAVAKVGKTKVLAGRVAGRARGNLGRSMSGDEGTALAGGFRHGKRSQKKNKRTLKSKLTAKKYSLKVGKKKKGKRGNKSQKRRKSIKIRI